MNSSRRIILTLILLLLIPGLPGLSASTDFRSWEFNAPEGIKGWRGEGVEGSRVQEGIFQVMGREQFRLISPSNLKILIQANPYLIIRFRSQSPRYLRVFWQPRLGKPVLLPEIIQPPFDRNFHTVWIPLTKKDEYRDTVEQVGLIFGGRPGWVEIDTIEIRPFALSSYLSDQWHEFWLPRALHLGTINSLSSPYIGGWSLVSMLNLLAVIVLIIGAAFYFRSSRLRRRQVVIAVGSVFLGLWMVYDLRETYSQFMIAREINRAYVQPHHGHKTYPALGDFYELVSLIEENIPAKSQYYFYQGWPYDCRLMYFVYPRRINCDASSNIFPGEPLPYHVVYRSPEVTYDPDTRRLRYHDMGMEIFVSNPGKIIARLEPGSYIFKED